MSTLPDIPRTFTALAEWLACLVLVSGQSKRLSRPLFWVVVVGWLAVQAAFLQLTGSVMPLPKEQRLIRLAVFAQKGFLMIRFENTVGGSLRFENGLPVSAKPAESRNFGLKNLLAVAERHGGTLTTHAEDGWFYLRLLMPLQQG